MNHDELLAKSDIDWKYVTIGQINERIKALRAVVETTQLENPAPISPAFGDGWRMAMLTVFSAIEKELK